MTTIQYVILSASRIANSNRVDQSGSDDGDVVDWDKANEIILATQIATSKGPIARRYSLFWRNVTDGGSFVTVGSTGQVKWAAAADTVLVDGATLTSGNKLCTTTPEPNWQDGMENEEDNLLPDGTTYSLADEYYTEFQWGLSLDDALAGKQYEFELWDITEFVSIGTCLAQITTYLPLTLPQTNSRIADASENWQGACDVDITDWDKSNDFILSTYATGGTGDFKGFKLQWKEAGGNFFNVSTVGAITFLASTTLVDGNTVSTPAGCLTSTMSEENEGDNMTGLFTPDTDDVIEIQWALDISGAASDTTYEFQLVCGTDDTSAVCSCSITIAGAVENCIPQTNSRISTATSGDWQGICDADIVNWVKTNEFILSTYATGGNADSKNFKLQWKESGGSFADVGVDTEIAWGTGTDLVDGNTIANEAGCLTATVTEENEGDNSATLDTMESADVGEIQWALGFGSGAQDGVTYEFQLVNTTDTESEICSCSITTYSAAAYSGKGIDRGINRGIL